MIANDGQNKQLPNELTSTFPDICPDWHARKYPKMGKAAEPFGKRFFF